MSLLFGVGSAAVTSSQLCVCEAAQSVCCATYDRVSLFKRLNRVHMDSIIKHATGYQRKTNRYDITFIHLIHAFIQSSVQLKP